MKNQNLDFSPKGVIKKIILMTSFLTLLLVACVKDGVETDTEETDTTGSVVNTNTNNLGSSHNTGKNCLGCHKFTAAGSVYKKDLASVFAGAKVKLTTQANGTGTEIGTFVVDNSGNFHTSASISFGSGLYVSVTGTSGTVRYMSSPVKNGACNSCHGLSTSKIWVE